MFVGSVVIPLLKFVLYFIAQFLREILSAIMPRKKYTSEFKTKIVLLILQRDKEFNVIYSENGLNPKMVRKWKQEFLQNANYSIPMNSYNKPPCQASCL